MDLLMACALFLQDKSAEETFKKIEDTVLNAKSVHLEFKVAGKVKALEREEAVERSGIVFLKEGNKVWARLKEVRGGKSVGLEILSDGERMQTKYGGQESKQGKTPENLRGDVGIGLIRQDISVVLGLYAGVAQLLDIEKVLAEFSQGEMRRWLVVADFTAGPDDGAAKTLTFIVKLGFSPAGHERPTEVKLWYDPKTYKLMKRTMHLKEVVGETTIMEETFTETYERFELDGDIPDEKFKLPAEK